MDIKKVGEYILEMHSIKPLYSNYFNQPLTLDDYFCRTAHTLLISKSFAGYNRIYVLSDDLEDATKELNALKGINVVNIPSKGDITSWEQLMQRSDFKLFGVYERFYNTKIRPQEEIKPIVYAKINQEEEIYDLFYNSGFFSIYTDYLPSHKELKQLIEQENVIINVADSQIQGAFLFSIEGQKCYFRAWIDNSNNGLKLLFDAYNIMVSKNLNYVYLWINSENKKVKTIHQLLGAKPDGLKDYTFIK
jgi:uncharacterized protein YlbG (UPF0298 family)